MRHGQKKSRQTNEVLEYIISNIPDLVIRIDQSAKITFSNAASILFFNKSPDDIIGKSFEQLILEEGISLLDKNLIDRIFETRQAEIIEGELTSTTGINQYVEIRILPELLELSKNPHLIFLVRDITHRKNYELKMITAQRKAEQDDRLKSAFLANMSHEIRTPLNAIVGFSQIILDEDITREEQERFYEYINQNSNQLINLVNDIIDLSKLESNQIVVNESIVNLNQVVSEMTVLAENEKKLREKEHLMIIPDTDVSDEDALVSVDFYRLKQILTNLMVNAIKFTPKGFIQFGYRHKDNETLLFFVRDTGIGIPLDKQGEIFQYFRQLDNSLNRANTGTGLGLAICKRLVELMKGKIWLQSEPGKGTTFFFSLPLHK